MILQEMCDYIELHVCVWWWGVSYFINYCIHSPQARSALKAKETSNIENVIIPNWNFKQCTIKRIKKTTRSEASKTGTLNSATSKTYQGHGKHKRKETDAQEEDKRKKRGGATEISYTNTTTVSIYGT